MQIIFWIAFVLTIVEFIASPANVLRGSAMHLHRFKEVNFPLAWAHGLAVLELLAVAAVIIGIGAPRARLIGGIVLATAFLPLLIWTAKAKRPVVDLLGLAFFMACAMTVALY